MACCITSRTSLTPAFTAESSTNFRPELCAIALAIVVFPVPGGPQRMTDVAPCSPGLSDARPTSGEPGVRRCFCPSSSSSVLGRIRTASGVTPVRNPGWASIVAMVVAATGRRIQQKPAGPVMYFWAGSAFSCHPRHIRRNTWHGARTRNARHERPVKGSGASTPARAFTSSRFAVVSETTG